jgi:hypothetical protein
LDTRRQIVWSLWHTDHEGMRIITAREQRHGADNMSKRPDERDDDIPEMISLGVGKYYERAMQNEYRLLEPDVAKVFRDSAVSQASRYQ